MIEYINKRLIDWAIWNKRREDGGLGYPGEANFCAMRATAGAMGSGLIVEDAAAMEIEHIIQALRASRHQLYDVAYWVYLAGDLTMDRVAKEMGCCRDTVYTRLHALHLHVMDALHEISIQAADRAAGREVGKKVLRIA